MAQNDVRNQVLSIELKKRPQASPQAGSRPLNNLTISFQRKVIKTSIFLFFWLLDKEVNRACQNGRIISSQRPIPHFNGGSLRLEQRTLR